MSLLIDAYVDRLFYASSVGDDILEYRADLAARIPALAIVFALATARSDGPRFVIDTVAVPLADYPTLDVADFMVSIYNNHTVQRLRIALPSGERLPAHDTLREAIDALRELHR